jgi:PRTRC genetic system protein B
MKPELTVDTKEAQSMKLTRAIMIYEGGHSYNNSERVHATVHEVSHGHGDTPTLLPGVSVDKPAIAGLLASLGESLAFNGFIPHRLLFVGPSTLIWWTPPGMRQVWFKDAKGKIGTRSTTTPHPGLVFAVAGGQWYVWAVKGDARPDPETVLYQAPYFNVWAGGQICTGNVELPRSFGIETIEGYERGFFGSYFTHANIHEKGKLTRHRGGPNGLWKALLDGQYATFPEEMLVNETQVETLSGLPERLNPRHR